MRPALAAVELMTDDKVAAFAGTLAEFYDRYLVPLNFAPYAEVVVDRANALRPHRVLETAAGTGVVTEALSRTLPSEVAITATDLIGARSRGNHGPWLLAAHGNRSGRSLSPRRGD
jgi:ubiquinone/menaquinone biosynthesis C-methylase UbiE